MQNKNYVDFSTNIPPNEFALEMFKNTDVHLNFAYYTRDYGTFAETQDRYFVKKNITGRVVASMYMHSGYKSPILSFYVIGKNNFCDELRVEFEQKYLTYWQMTFFWSSLFL